LEGDGDNVFEAACKLGLEGIVTGPCKAWIKVKNPRSPAYLRIIDGTF
jgi:ATP-dependent DNA ligase